MSEARLDFLIFGFAALLWIALAAIVLGNNRPEDLDRLTGYYSMRMAVPVDEVRFESDLIQCPSGRRLCACSVPTQHGLVVTYSLSLKCVHWPASDRVLEELCATRMNRGSQAMQRDVEECATWYR